MNRLVNISSWFGGDTAGEFLLDFYKKASTLVSMNNCYTETLGQAMDAITNCVEAKEVVIAENSKDWLVDGFNFGGLRYGEDKEVHAEIETIKGKRTVKYAHAHIWRHDVSGRYEWLVYIL